MTSHARIEPGCLIVRAALLAGAILGAAAGITLTALIPRKETSCPSP